MPEGAYTGVTLFVTRAFPFQTPRAMIDEAGIS